MTMNEPLKESIQATVDGVNETPVTPQDMIEIKTFVNGFARRPSLIDVSRHLQFDLQHPDQKTQAILLRYIGLIRTVEKGIPGASWDATGSRHMISDALLAAAAMAPLRYVENTIRFDVDDLLRSGLQMSHAAGRA